MSFPRSRPSLSATEYVYRRDLAPRELIPAMAVGLGMGLAAFYVARVLLQRTPLDVRGSRPDLRSHRAGEG